MRMKLLVAAALVAAAATVAAAPAPGGASSLAAVRAATTKYHRVGIAKQAGYGLLVDLKKISCIDMPGTGAMGVHYVKGPLVADPAVDASKPEGLVYEPGANGALTLVAVEYVTIKKGWDATHASPPSLFGRPFNLTPSPNRFGLPAFYSLHVWIWKHNPAGTFAMWNPDATCAKA